MVNKRSFVLLALCLLPLFSCSSKLPYDKADPEGYTFYCGLFKTDSSFDKANHSPIVSEIEIAGKTYPFSEPESIQAYWLDDGYVYGRFNYKENEESFGAIYHYSYSDNQLEVLTDPIFTSGLSFYSCPSKGPVFQFVADKQNQYGAIIGNQFFCDWREIVYANQKGYVYRNAAYYFYDIEKDTSTKIADEATFLVNKANDDIFFVDGEGYVNRLSFEKAEPIKLEYSPASFALIETTANRNYSILSAPIYEARILSYKNDNQYEIVDLAKRNKDIYEIGIGTIDGINKVLHYENSPIINIAKIDEVFTVDTDQKTANVASFKAKGNNEDPYIQNLEFKLYEDDKYTFYESFTPASEFMAGERARVFLLRQKKGEDKKAYTYSRFVSDSGLRGELTLGITYISSTYK